MPGVSSQTADRPGGIVSSRKSDRQSAAFDMLIWIDSRLPQRCWSRWQDQDAVRQKCDSVAASPPKFSLPSLFPTLFPSPPYALNFPSYPFPPSLFFFLIRSFPSLSPFPSPSFPPLRSRPPVIQLGGLGSTVSSPSGVWGRAPAEIKFGAF